MSTFSPDEAWSPSARSRVTVSNVKSCGETPAQSVTFLPSLNVPIGTSTPAGFRSQASSNRPLSRRARPWASSSIRQPEDVFVSVALPAAPGASSVGPSAAWKLPGRRPGADDREPDHRGGGRDGDRADRQREPGRGARARRAALRLDRGAEAGRRLDLRRRAPRERDRALLLGEAVGQLGRLRRPCLELGSTMGRQRAVGERRQLGDLLAGRGF